MPHRFRILAATVAAFAAVSAPPPSAAEEIDTSAFEFRSFSGKYELSLADGGTSRVTITETIVPVFPEFDQNRGIIRDIPDLYQGVPLHTEVKSVEDRTGEPVPNEVLWDEDRGFVQLALGTDEFVHGEQTFRVEHTQRNVVGTFSDTDADEFYWDVNGTGWGQPFAEVSAVVTMDPGVAATLTGDAACYVGGFGETTQCGIQRTDDGGVPTFTARAAGLAPHETLTVAIGFASGTFVQAQPDPDYVSAYQPQAPGWSSAPAITALAKALQKASKAAAKPLRTDGLVEPIPKWLRGGWLRTTAIVLLVVAFGNEFFVVPEGADSPWTFGAMFAGVAALILSAFLARKPTRFTEKGAEGSDYLRGITLYLEVAEEDRIRMLQSPEGAERVEVRGGVGTVDRVQLVKLYERLLPFAVIWGVEKEWMDQLAVRIAEAQTSPDWFAGRNGFSSGAIMSTLHGVGRTASVTSTSSAAAAPAFAAARAAASPAAAGAAEAGAAADRPRHPPQ